MPSLISVSASPFWHSLTRLGEIQLLLPLALLSALWLWRQSRAHQVPAHALLARRWIFYFGLAIALTGASKLAFFGWGLGVAAWDFTGISGHAMAAAAVLPVLSGLALLGRARALRGLGIGLGFCLAALLAYSRLKVGAHSPAESLAGFMLGGLVGLLSLCLLPELPSGHAPTTLGLPLGLLAVLLLVPLGAPKSRTHDWVIQLSLQLSGRSQPFVRRDLHRPRNEPLGAGSSPTASSSVQHHTSLESKAASPRKSGPA